jgi:hypothetical protein
LISGPWEAHVGVIWSMGGPCGCYLVHGRPMWVLFGPWEAHVGVIWSMGGPTLKPKP